MVLQIKLGDKLCRYSLSPLSVCFLSSVHIQIKSLDYVHIRNHRKRNIHFQIFVHWATHCAPQSLSAATAPNKLDFTTYRVSWIGVALLRCKQALPRDPDLVIPRRIPGAIVHTRNAGAHVPSGLASFSGRSPFILCVRGAGRRRMYSTEKAFSPGLILWFRTLAPIQAHSAFALSPSAASHSARGLDLF